jgi:hypothetical protein
MVKTRTVVQIRTHAQKYFQKLNKTSGGASWNKFDKSDDSSSPFSVSVVLLLRDYPVVRLNGPCCIDTAGT